MLSADAGYLFRGARFLCPGRSGGQLHKDHPPDHGGKMGDTPGGYEAAKHIQQNNHTEIPGRRPYPVQPIRTGTKSFMIGTALWGGTTRMPKARFDLDK